MMPINTDPGPPSCPGSVLITRSTKIYMTIALVLKLLTRLVSRLDRYTTEEQSAIHTFHVMQLAIILGEN